MSILVTGANGFVGKHLVKKLLESNLEVKTLSTKPNDFLSVSSYKLNLECDSLCDDAAYLHGVNCIVHLAGRAHLKGRGVSSAEQFMQINCDYPLKLARLAVINGVKRFIFISTIGVNGRSNTAPFNYKSPFLPYGDYANSKCRAEIALTEFCHSSGLELVIIRPPLVYGIDAPGNFDRLKRLVILNVPMPFGAVKNSRSFVHVDNLVDLIFRCVYHTKAAGGVFLVSDDCDVSTSDFLLKLYLAAGNTPRSYNVPVKFLKLFFYLSGRRDLNYQLINSLVLDINHTKSTLDWFPPFSLEEGIKRCF